MAKILTSDVVQECLDIAAEDPPGGTCGLASEWVGRLCDSNEALRDLLRRVTREYAYYDPDRRVYDVLQFDLQAEVDAALEGKP